MMAIATVVANLKMKESVIYSGLSLVKDSVQAMNIPNLVADGARERLHFMRLLNPT